MIRRERVEMEERMREHDSRPVVGEGHLRLAGPAGIRSERKIQPLKRSVRAVRVAQILTKALPSPALVGLRP
jgi:hypothetical protein